ncbi:MAG TPA: hypothetical protein EYP49_20800 [Anaerolineae bacterium]|nr:hypothetical protein [Anaerolineae bacterium]
MQPIIDIGGSIVAWAVVLLRLNEALKGDERVLKAWRFALAFALFGTFQIDTVYLAFDALVGLNNLSWFLSYIFENLSIYYLCATCCNKIPRWARLYQTITLVLITVTFPLGPNRAPESAYHVIPYNVAELLFMGTCYIYGATMITLIPLRAIIRAYRNERDLALRLRSLVGLSAGSAILTFFVTKFAISLFTFIVPSLRPFAGSANTIVNIAVLVMAVLWPLLFAPNRIYVIPARFIRFLDKILTLTRLRALRVKLDRLYPTRSSENQSGVLSLSKGWLDQLRDPDFYICREVIRILDDMRLLATSKDHRDDPSLNEAIHLHRILQSANPSPDPAIAYRELSKQLLRRTL